ncbi:response regulator [Paenibacillus sp. HWE-109]|uniref:response regulator n=1 Tax=Paenibacillus sp. HWE-109 TaxID=1306526 RepID=UPI001EDFDA5E|nr:response regulator [Paenibacillus sp. HWE-109]UKS26864.1 response regulator [Paenibacillus sp. HWE-109]
MWTVLLVEDEAFVRRSIRKGMPWEENGFQVIEECGNGEEALSIIRKVKPDLVICDIMMPVMNGVELLAQVRQEQLDTCFIMLTVMNDFAFIQQAMELGASGYVLKLYLSPEKMTEALTKVKGELERNSRLISKEINDYCEELYSGTNKGEELLANPAFIQEMFQPNWLILIAHGQHAFAKQDLRQLSLFEWEINPKVHIFTKLGFSTVFCMMPEETKIHIHNNELRSNYIVVISELAENEDVAALWESMLSRVTELWYANRSGIFFYQPKVLQDQAFSGLPWQLEKNLIQAFEQMNLGLLELSWQEIWAWTSEVQLSLLRVKEIALRLDRLFAELACVQAESPAIYTEAVSHLEAGRHFKQRIDMYMAHWKAAKYEVTDHIEINKVIAYMNGHFEDELSLSLLAGIATMDDKYLSVLFKKKTGKTVTEYLMDIRIKKACDLLLQTDQPVALIGAKVGFPNENYFARMFRREVGMPPSVFRQQHIK